MEFHGRRRVQRPQTQSSGGNGPGNGTRMGTDTPDGDSDRVVLTRNLTVQELAEKLAVQDTVVIKHLFFKMQQMRTINQMVGLDYAKQLATEMGYEVVNTELPDHE